MNGIINFIHVHQATSLLIAYYVGSAFTASLAAPTKDSSPQYVFLFRFVNILAANISRAYSHSVENSPNFEDAVKIRNGNGSTEKEKQNVVNS